ncbi:MAG: hypothetical protein ABR538_06960 [Candidatus Binatia bacterium]
MRGSTGTTAPRRARTRAALRLSALRLVAACLAAALPATALAGTSAVLPVVVTTTTSTSSTSTSTSTSTTTLPGDRPCGDPVALKVKLSGSGPQSSAVSRAVVAGDALFLLKVAVGTFQCSLCTCDVNDSGSVTATDALIVLKIAVGQVLPLNCPPCL